MWQKCENNKYKTIINNGPLNAENRRMTKKRHHIRNNNDKISDVIIKWIHIFVA